MMTSADSVLGNFLREQVLVPAHLSVSAAARLMGVSRITLSKLVNNQGAITAKMAARMEQAFGVSAEKLLKLQAEADAATSEKKLSEAENYSYPFPEIRARDLESWADTIEARTELPVLIRRLVATTGSGVSRCDFPGYDNGQRAGWDGVVEATGGTPWIPVGLSVWELGTNQEVERKATTDFAKRNRNPLNMDCAGTAYVCVTPRVWSPKRKTEWLHKAKAQKCWKDVRIYDAEDLERWLERSLEARIWLAERLNRPEVTGVRTLDSTWEAWINSSYPVVGQEFFAEAVAEHQGALKAFLLDSEASHMVISAASAEEGLAYLWSALQTGALSGCRDRLLVFDSAETLRKMGCGRPDFIAVVHDLETAAVCQTLNRSMKSIFIRATAEEDDADMVLRPLSDGAMFQLPDHSFELFQDCGGSLTVLHRRWSRFPEQRYPLWSRDTEKAAGLLVAAMMGQWNAESEWQRSILMQLTGGKSLKGFEQSFKRGLKTSDAPVWRYDHVCGVVSKSDIFFSLREALTPAVLNRFYDTLLTVLQTVWEEEGDEIGLPKVNRDREAGQTRHQLMDTAAFFSAHGSFLVKDWCTYDFERKGTELIQQLLQSLTATKLEQVGWELSGLAEVGSGALLQILEADWTSSQSVIRDLLSEVAVQNNVLQHLFSAMALSAQLSEDDFLKTCRLLAVWWTACPNNSVRRCEIQTLLKQLFTPGKMGEVPPEHLSQALCWMVKTFPGIGRWLCYQLLVPKDVIVEESLLSPHWKSGGQREWAEAEKTAYQNTIGELLLSITGQSTKGLVELLAVTNVMSPSVLAAFYERLVRWYRRKPSDEAVAEMKEAIRRMINFRLLPDDRREDFKVFYQQLEPKDIVQKYRWLFADANVDYAAGETQEVQFDWQLRNTMMERLRSDALKTILAARGIKGILELTRYGTAQFEIGQSIAKMLTDEEWSELWMLSVTATDEAKREALVRGLTVDVLSERLQHLGKWRPILPKAMGLRLLRWMPFNHVVWQWMAQTVPEWSEDYWKTVLPVGVSNKEDGLAAVQSLLAVHRPWAAFVVVQRQPELLGVEWLLKILLAMLQSSEEVPWRAEYFREAMKVVVQTQSISRDTKAYLVFYYINLLCNGNSVQSENINVLSSYIAEHPEFYVNLVGWAFQRDDGKTDAALYRNKAVDLGGISRTTLRAFQLTETLKTEFSYGRLKNWVNSVRQGCREIGRLSKADSLLGSLMVRSLYDKKAVRFPMNFYRLLTVVDSEGLVQTVVKKLQETREPRWCSVEEYGALDQWMVNKIREEMERVRYQWPRGLKVWRVLEQQYLAEAKAHETSGKIYGRRNVLPW